MCYVYEHHGMYYVDGDCNYGVKECKSIFEVIVELADWRAHLKTTTSQMIGDVASRLRLQNAKREARKDFVRRVLLHP